MRWPAHQHTVGGGGAKHVTGRFFPGQVLGLGLALVRLRAGELTVAAVVGLVAPYPRRRREHRVLAGEHPRIVRFPPAAVDHDLVANRDLGDLVANGPDDARAVASAGVKILGLALLLAVGDDVDGITEGCPHVVEVYSRRHDVDENVLRPHGGSRDHLAPPRFLGFAEAVLTDHEGVHLFGHFAKRCPISQFADFHASPRYPALTY